MTSGFARTLALAALLAAAGSAAFVILQLPTGREAASQTDATDGLLPVGALRVDMQSAYEIERAFTGRVTARRRSDLGFDRDGTLAEILVESGDRVRAGQVLARLDTARLEARRRELQATRAEATADLKLARSTRARTVRLFEDGHVSEQRRDEAVAEADAAAARLERIDAQLASLEVDLGKSVIEAPYAGTIERRLLDEGTVLDAGTTVVRLLETRVLEAEIGFPLSFARRMEPGSHVPLRTEKGDLVFASVRSMVPAVRGETRTALVTFTIEGEVTADIADGSLVTAHVEDRIESPGFWLPLGALTADVRGLWRVYKVGDRSREAGTAEVVFENVQVLHTAGDRAFVSGTVDDGDLLIDGGVTRVVPGQRVRVVSIDGAPVDARGET